MSELNSKYNELSNEIYRNFIFYIPISILNMEEFKNLTEESISIAERITYYIDDDLNFINENSLNFQTLLIKSGKLKAFGALSCKYNIKVSTLNCRNTSRIVEFTMTSPRCKIAILRHNCSASSR